MKSRQTRAKATSSKQAVRKGRPAVRSKVLTDDRIDTADIAPLTDDFFRRAIRNPFYRPVKQSTTVRIDADVLAWLKAQGPGYQTRINALLRAAMQRASEGKGSA